MFAPSMAIPRFGHRRAPRLATKIAIVVAQFAVLVAFAIAGTVFLGLMLASPIGLPIAQRQGVAVSPADLATAQQLASLWFAFAVGAIVAFGASLVTLGNVMQRLAAPPAAE